MRGNIKWVAQLSHVREVSLRGDADLSYWQERLAPQGLLPVERGGRAEVLVISADGRFRGIRFREVSFSLSVRPPDASLGNEAALLLHAFNSSRFFAWCERTFFSTPYFPGDVRIEAAMPASLHLRLGGLTAFRAAMMSERRRQPLSTGEAGWDGAVLLPLPRRGGPRKFFRARIRGETFRYLFDPAGDAFELQPTRAHDVFAALADSRFTPRHWDVRIDASHAKSKTRVLSS